MDMMQLKASSVWCMVNIGNKCSFTLVVIMALILMCTSIKSISRVRGSAAVLAGFLLPSYLECEQACVYTLHF